MSLDGSLRKVAQTVLGKFGTSTVFQRVTPAAYNTTTRRMLPVTTEYPVKMRLEEYDDHSFSDTIKTGDRKGTIASADIHFVPTVSDKVIKDGLAYDIVNIRTTLATDEAAIYELQLRR